jgi:hypothetical protein
VPNFPAAGSSVVYKGPAAYWVGFADCCVAGDKYKVTASGPLAKSSTTFTSSGTLNADCATSAVAGENYIGNDGGSTKVKMTAIALPGGAGAGAYVQTSASGWHQTSGTDQCGF